MVMVKYKGRVFTDTEFMRKGKGERERERKGRGLLHITPPPPFLAKKKHIRDNSVYSINIIVQNTGYHLDFVRNL